jgi:D-serine deaminase-like pyridoxal phosphate-dependent protein
MTCPFDRATADLDPPLAVVDLAAFDRNAARLAGLAAGRPIRVVSKSLRCRFLIERALGLPGFAGLMCYSVAEALWHAGAGTAADILVAYPSADRAALRALAADERARALVTLMVDSIEQLDLLPRAPLRVCLDLDASWRPVRGLRIGPRRSPVHTPEQAARLAREITARPGLRLVGLMAYEGQIAGVPDDTGSAVRDRAVRWMQRRSAAELAGRRAAAVAAVTAVAGPLAFVNGGGSGSVAGTAADASVTEIAAGSGLVGPGLFDGYTGLHPEPAVLFALPVVRRPDRRSATLYAGGYPASGAAGASRLPVPHLPAGLALTGVEGAGEVQTPVTGRAARRLRVGDRVWLRHAKAGELAERFDRYHVIEGGRTVRTVPTYRGEGRSFG